VTLLQISVLAIFYAKFAKQLPHENFNIECTCQQSGVSWKQSPHKLNLFDYLSSFFLNASGVTPFRFETCGSASFSANARISLWWQSTHW